jgi:hypothetical protein
MTPKEKAAELVEKFNYLVLEKDFFGDNIEHKNSKRCAIIAVDEILNIRLLFFDEKEYWQKVKKEIENL